MLPTARRVLSKHASGLAGRSPAFNLSPYARRRLLATLAILEQKDGQLNHGSLSAFTAAKKLGGPVHGFVAGSNIKPVAEQAAKVDGVEKIIAVDNGAYDKVREPAGFSPTSLADHSIGTPRELRSFAGREHQEGRLHARCSWSQRFWQESNAPCSGNDGRTADQRHY